MPKKEGWIDAIAGLIADIVKLELAERVKGLVHRAQDIAYKTEEKLLELLMAYLLLMVGLIAIIYGLVKLVSYYLNINTGWISLIAGIILLMFAVRMKKNFEKKKMYEW